MKFKRNDIERPATIPMMYGWEQLTEYIIERTWGKHSRQHLTFCEIAEDHYDGSDLDKSFRIRIEQHEAVLESFIGMLKLEHPEEGKGGAYEPGEEYKFYRDLSGLVGKAEKRIFIVDPYLDEDIFLYVNKALDATNVLILSKKIEGNVVAVGAKLARNRPLELRSSQRIHDRLIFIDSRGWVTGHSIRHAAQRTLEGPLSSHRDTASYELLFGWHRPPGFR